MSKEQFEDAKNRLILALDVPDVSSGVELLKRVDGQVGLVKIGLELFTRGGPGVVETVKKMGYDIFLDLKFHDIPNTVAGAVRSARSLGVSMLTVHVGGGKEMLLRAAAEAGDEMIVLGVTLLTSLGIEDLFPVAIESDPEGVVLRRAKLASESALRGVVCSPQEIERVRETVGTEMVIVTPGIRKENAEIGDQKRAATPKDAIARGADYLVVGRPISGAADPGEAARSIVEEMALGLKLRQ